ncbi:MAG: TetR/AcrR family transcriptional regulator [Dermatophilaceae bacterium]
MTAPAQLPRRGYHSPQRRERARRTERRIVDAGTALLVSRGWAGTTMADVARAADVSPAMLYKVFRTKAELVKRIYDVTLVGDQQDVPFRERPEFHLVLAEPDPARKLTGYAHLMRQVAERVLPVYQQLRAAVTVGEGEDELRALADTADAERLFGARGIVRDLLTVTSLRPGLREQQAVDLVWMTMSPEFWSLLVTRRGWSWDGAQTWVGRHLRTSLLAGDAAEPP